VLTKDAAIPWCCLETAFDIRIVPDGKLQFMANGAMMMDSRVLK
jgi:hypothetical protein